VKEYIVTFVLPVFFTVEADNKAEAEEEAREHMKRVERRITSPDPMGPSFDTADYQMTELEEI
jgi:hypothetical protein